MGFACADAMDLGLVSNRVAAVHPETTDDVAKIVKIVVKYKMPVLPHSEGSSERKARTVRPTIVRSSRSFDLSCLLGGLHADFPGMGDSR